MCVIKMFTIRAPQQMLFVFIKWRIMRWGKGVAHVRRREIHIVFWLGNLKEGDNVEDIGADGRIILKSIFKK